MHEFDLQKSLIFLEFSRRTGEYIEFEILIFIKKAVASFLDRADRAIGELFVFFWQDNSFSFDS
jgi:hypothetical protein